MRKLRWSFGIGTTIIAVSVWPLLLPVIAIVAMAKFGQKWRIRNIPPKEDAGG